MDDFKLVEDFKKEVLHKGFKITLLKFKTCWGELYSGSNNLQNNVIKENRYFYNINKALEDEKSIIDEIIK